MKPWMFSHVGCSLACGSMDPSEANLNLWIKPTLLLRPGSFAAVSLEWPRLGGTFGRVGQVRSALRFGWPWWCGDPASYLLCCSPVVCLLDPARSWWVLSFESWCTGLHLVWTCIVVQGRAGCTTRCGRAYLMCLGAPEFPLILILQIKTQHNLWNLVSI
jgi:hypothetical protein